ncbi:MAG: hypothetical protein ACO1SV_10245 [Fimbriimonas sp.]
MKSVRLGIVGLIGCAATLASASDLVIDNAAGPWGEVAAPVPAPISSSPRGSSRLPYALLAAIGVGVIYWKRKAER